MVLHMVHVHGVNRKKGKYVECLPWSLFVSSYGYIVASIVGGWTGQYQQSTVLYVLYIHSDHQIN